MTNLQKFAVIGCTPDLCWQQDLDGELTDETVGDHSGQDDLIVDAFDVPDKVAGNDINIDDKSIVTEQGKKV